ncbi:MAG: hypothetical protein ACI4CT_09605 [Lachnospiraceae bacterium]
MSEYKRMISYLYRYDSGVRSENVGYVRIEQNQEEVKLAIRLRDVHVIKRSDCKVMLYYRVKGETTPYFITAGITAIMNGEAQWRVSTGSENLFASGKTLEEMSGMLIYVDRGLLYATQWDSFPFEPGKYYIDSEQEPCVTLQAASVETVEEKQPEPNPMRTLQNSGLILGVPGVYSRQNEYLASLLGFCEFIPSESLTTQRMMEKQEQSEKYGYYIRTL